MVFVLPFLYSILCVVYSTIIYCYCISSFWSAILSAEIACCRTMEGSYPFPMEYVILLTCPQIFVSSFAIISIKNAFMYQICSCRKISESYQICSCRKVFESCLAIYPLFFLGRIITIHVYNTNLITEEKIYSKLSLVDLAGSESLSLQEDGGEHATDLLHVMKSLSAYVLHFLAHP